MTKVRAYDIFLPVTDAICPQCRHAVDGICFGNDMGSVSLLRPCAHYVDIEHARQIVGDLLHPIPPSR